MHTFLWQGHKLAAVEGGDKVLVNVWVGNTSIYVLILPNNRFLPIRGALVGSLFHLPPPRPCLVGLSEQVAEPCSRSLSQSRAADPCDVQQDPSSPAAPGE